MRAAIGVVPLMSALLTYGCATRPLQPAREIDWDRRAASLLVEPDWRAQGRIAFRSGKEGGQGSMIWVQSGDTARISLSGPFGAGAYQINWDQQQIVVNSRNGERVAAYTGRDAADRFLEQQLGWSFPARSIRYWLLGVADPDYRSEQRIDATGWLSRIEQNGWGVEYSRFDKVDERYLPGKVVMENEQARVKLVIDKWSWGRSTGSGP